MYSYNMFASVSFSSGIVIITLSSHVMYYWLLYEGIIMVYFSRGDTMASRTSEFGFMDLTCWGAGLMWEGHLLSTSPSVDFYLSVINPSEGNGKLLNWQEYHEQPTIDEVDYYIL